MKLGDRIKIKDADGLKWWGRVTGMESQADVHDATIGGLFPGGPPPDTMRKMITGPRVTILTIVLEGPRD